MRAARARAQFCGPVRPHRQPRRPAPQPRALSEAERTQVVQVLTSEHYQDQPAAQVYYDLLQQGTYLCSVSTMHRLMRTEGLNGKRRQQRPRSAQPIPRLLATAPNQVWTWDIAKLPTQRRGEYLSLYVVMDLFSRHIVAWMLSRKENSALSSQLIEQAYERYGIAPNSLTLHQDRGVPMTAHCYLDLLGELAITASHSRPRVSNDNAMSESQFKTMKYQPDYPRRFDNYGHALRCLIFKKVVQMRLTRSGSVLDRSVSLFSSSHRMTPYFKVRRMIPPTIVDSSTTDRNRLFTSLRRETSCSFVFPLHQFLVFTHCTTHSTEQMRPLA